MQSSSCFIHLLSKHPNHEQDFFQILCASQKVRTLSKTETNSSLEFAGFSYFCRRPKVMAIIFRFGIVFDPKSKKWYHFGTTFALSQLIFKRRLVGLLKSKCSDTPTTDAQRGNSLHCTAENSIPIPNF